MARGGTHLVDEESQRVLGRQHGVERLEE